MLNNSKFWLYNPKQLFMNADIIPLPDIMSFEEQLNAITRLIIIIYIILCLMDYKHSIYFLILSLLFIILIFLINKEMTKSKENFEFDLNYSRTNKDDIKRLYTSKQNAVWCTQPQNVRSATFAINQSLAGPPNPKTNIPPIIPPKAQDNDYWKPNDFVTRPQINELPRKLWKQSGYLIPETCENNFQLPNKKIKQKPKFNKIREPCNSEWKTYFDPDFEECCSKKNNQTVFNNVTLKTDKDHAYKPCAKDTKNVDDFVRGHAASGARTNLTDLIKPKSKSNANNTIKENFTQDKRSNKKNSEPIKKKCTAEETKDDIQVKYGVPIQICQPQDGDFIDGCGYNPRKLIFSNLQSNAPSGVCEEFPTMVGYNESVNTQIIQPGVYSKNEIMEPQVYNLGISHAQQFEPVKVENDQFGNKIFVQQDPRLNCSKNQNIVIEPPSPNESNVFDPRMSGYGSQNRAYLDPLTGRPRFYYDDINAIREGNFFIKSNVDSLPFTDHRGAMKTDMDRKNYLDNHRKLIQDQYLNDTLQNRTELQERLTRKINQRQTQLRKAPLRFNDISRKY